MKSHKPEPEAYDNLSLRCPRLGHEVPFRYCRQAEADRPCSRILGCWIERMPVVDYLRETFGEETLKQLSQPKSSNKITSLIEEVRKHQKQK